MIALHRNLKDRKAFMQHPQGTGVWVPLKAQKPELGLSPQGESRSRHLNLEFSHGLVIFGP